MGNDIAPQPVDQNELRTNQVLGAGVLVCAAVLGRWELVAFQAGVLLLATVQPRLSPYRVVYRMLLLPLGLIQPDRRNDHLAAHRFASLLGFLITTTASYLLMTGHTQLGWSLVWLVITLTAIAVLGWCAGCFMYYALHRLGLTRFFKHAPIACTIPCARPPKSIKQKLTPGEN